MPWPVKTAALAALAAGLALAPPLAAQDTTLTLTKMVDVYDGQPLPLAPYEVRPGDTLSRILRRRGLNGPQALDLARRLNPGLVDADRLAVGQTLVLPGAREGELGEVVRVYERPQAGQSPARVVVWRKPDLADYPSGNEGPLGSEGAVVYRTVKIRPGDTLERLLRREGMDAPLIYNHLLKIVLNLNPQIKDPDLILAGAEVRLPAAGNYLAPLAGVGVADIKARAADQAALRLARRSSPLRLPTAAAESPKKALARVLADLGAEVEAGGEFPVAAFPGGRRVVIDWENRLPGKARLALPPGTAVFTPRRGESLEAALPRLLTALRLKTLDK